MITAAKALLQAGRRITEPVEDTVTLTFRVSSAGDTESITVRLRQLTNPTQVAIIRENAGEHNGSQATLVFKAELRGDTRTLPSTLNAGDTAPHTIMGQHGIMKLQPSIDKRYGSLKTTLGEHIILAWFSTHAV